MNDKPKRPGRLRKGATRDDAGIERINNMTPEELDTEIARVRTSFANLSNAVAILTERAEKEES